jgi:uncharacterized protein
VTRIRLASGLLGVAFGFLISWGQFIDPDRIRDMLVLSDAYMWEMFAAAVAVGFVGLRLMRRVRMKALLTGEPVSWSTARPERRHVVGGAIFGAGWAVSDVCPGPVAAQVGQGILWVLPLLAGVLLGINLYLRGQDAPSAGRDDVRLGGAVPASSPD